MFTNKLNFARKKFHFSIIEYIYDDSIRKTRQICTILFKSMIALLVMSVIPKGSFDSYDRENIEIGKA
jgi:hypothetical protein